jgi:para-aminobenzoate synthetase component I
MMTPQSLPWMEPLALAATIDEPFWVLLYSSARTPYSGRFSYLACGLQEKIESGDFTALGAHLTHDRPRFDNTWLGYLAYGLKDCVESLVPEPPGNIALPDLCMMRFGRIYEFDHETSALTCWSAEGIRPVAGVDIALAAAPRTGRLSSNMSKQQYFDRAAHLIERIHAGDLYQANLTRKFSGKFEDASDALGLFTRLCNISPAPFSAYLRLGETHILSSSPERFLSIAQDGRISARPIKGTAPRHHEAGKDEASRRSLIESAKDRAENLMIVDLMRNDLSKSCVPGSIAVDELFNVTSHATIHHMSSTVSGLKKAGIATLDAIKGCFPPGSMTGAPKIKAMNLCAELEDAARGVYSGAIGWLGGDGSAELSVVIRTLILQNGRFEFQVGGGIVADSTPEREWRETVDKAAGILAALGLERSAIEQI